MKIQFVKQDSLTKDFPHIRISLDSKQGVKNHI